MKGDARQYRLGCNDLAAHPPLRRGVGGGVGLLTPVPPYYVIKAQQRYTAAGCDAQNAEQSLKADLKKKKILQKVSVHTVQFSSTVSCITYFSLRYSKLSLPIVQTVMPFCNTTLINLSVSTNKQPPRANLLMQFKKLCECLIYYYLLVTKCMMVWLTNAK